MKEIIGVRFRPNGKIYYFDPQNFEVEAGSFVIVETARGVEYGNMIEMGVNDPVKVTRTALQSAASVAALILITEATINDIPKDPDPAALAAMAGAGGGMGGMM